MRSLIKIIFGNVVIRVIVFAAFAIYGYFTLSDSERDETVRDKSGEVIEGGDVGALVLQIGDCFQFPKGFIELEEDESQTYEKLSVVPCTDLHDAEIISSRTLFRTDYPGEDAFGGELSDFCVDDYRSYTGFELYTDGPHLIIPLYPTQEGWDQGDKEILCAVRMENGEKLGASVRG
jgi:hypothetical protein